MVTAMVTATPLPAVDPRGWDECEGLPAVGGKHLQRRSGAR